MAIGESRRAAKQQLRQEQGPTWSVSDGKLHSFKTRSVYQEHILKFVSWARETQGITDLEALDQRAGALATQWLTAHVAEGKSPYTLQVERAALRLFFADRTLAAEVQLPQRRRSSITRSRQAVAHDKHFQPANWQPLLTFLRATGLRRQEVQHLRCRDIFQGQDGSVLVHVENGKGGRMRDVPVLPGQEDVVFALKEGRDPDAPVFERIPRHLDVHSYRREFAQALYLYHAPGRTLPPPAGRLQPKDYDRTAAQYVSWALGHNRIDVVLRHYLR